MIDVNGVLNDVRKLANISYEQGYLNGQKHYSCMLEQIKDLIRESDKNHAYTLSYPAYVFITRLKKIVGWKLEDYEEPKGQQIPKYCEDCIFSDETLEERKIHCYRCYYKSEWKDKQNELTCDDCEQDCDDRDGLCAEFKRNKKDGHEERHTNDTWSVKEVSDSLERHGII